VHVKLRSHHHRLCLTAGGNAALAQPAIDTAGATQCSTRGYNTDRDPE
jgi:hypothetical protein